MKKYKFKDENSNCELFFMVNNDNSLSIDAEVFTPGLSDNEYINASLSSKGAKLLYETLKKRFETNDNPTDTPFEAGEVIVYDGMYACTISAESNGTVQCVPLDDPDYIQEWKIFLDGKKCIRVPDSQMDSELREFQQEVKVCLNL